MKVLTKRFIATLAVFTLMLTHALPFSTSVAWAGEDSSRTLNRAPTGAVIAQAPVAPQAPTAPAPRPITPPLATSVQSPSSLSSSTKTESIKLADGKIFYYDSVTKTGNVEGKYYKEVNLILSGTDTCTKGVCKPLLRTGIAIPPGVVQIGMFFRERPGSAANTIYKDQTLVTGKLDTAPAPKPAALTSGYTPEQPVDFNSLYHTYYADDHAFPGKALQGVIKSKNDLNQFWQSLVGSVQFDGNGKPAAAPNVDFDKYQVIYSLSAGGSTGGYDTRIVGMTAVNGEVKVKVKNTSPKPGNLGTQALQRPLDFVLVKKTDVGNRSVKFEFVNDNPPVTILPVPQPAPKPAPVPQPQITVSACTFQFGTGRVLGCNDSALLPSPPRPLSEVTKTLSTIRRTVPEVASAIARTLGLSSVEVKDVGKSGRSDSVLVYITKGKK